MGKHKKLLLTPILYLLFTPQRLYECICIYGNFQWVLAPFLIIGIFVNMKDMIKQKTILWKNILIIFWIAVYLTTTVVHKDMTTWHLNSLMFISLIFIFDGLKVYVLKIQNKNLQLVFVLLVIAIFVITTCSFLFYYYAGDYANDEANFYYVYEDIVPVLEEVDKIKTENQNVYILIPSMTYRIKEKIPYFEPKSQYEKAKELPIMIDNYTFDMGAVSLRNPDPSAIYVVIDCYEAYKEALIPLNMETITVGNYIIYVGGKTT